MLTEREIISILDNSNSQGAYCSFTELGHVYSYLIDCRLNIFRNPDGRWAIATERLGFNPRAGAIELDINYFGNCLLNLDEYNGEKTNWYSVYPVDRDSFDETVDGEVLNPEAGHWLVRGAKVDLVHNEKDYLDAGIDLEEPGEVRVEEAARLLIIKSRDLFRATDKELYRSIPPDLEKIMVLVV